jgi:predicted Zn-dependent protease with MMP-like domain
MIAENLAHAQSSSNSKPSSYSMVRPAQPNEPVMEFVANTEGRLVTIKIPQRDLLFKVNFLVDKNSGVTSSYLSLRPELGSVYQIIGKTGNHIDTVVISPLFTRAAYQPNGFYDFYNNKCDSRCLTVSLPSGFGGTYSSSYVGLQVFDLLNYTIITDANVDKNPDLLKQYKRVIVLHNEYVTKREFDAITNHPDVIFFYPNALYAEVAANYVTNTITLVKGHGYPASEIRNAFGWKGDNSKYEYDVECDEWNFYIRLNKTLLNCYPEYRMLYDAELLRYLQIPDPTDIPIDISNWLRYPDNLIVTKTMIGDFDIKGKYIPSWVASPADWYLDGEISRVEFADIMTYLYDNKIIR